MLGRFENLIKRCSRYKTAPVPGWRRHVDTIPRRSCKDVFVYTSFLRIFHVENVPGNFSRLPDLSGVCVGRCVCVCVHVARQSLGVGTVVHENMKT